MARRRKYVVLSIRPSEVSELLLIQVNGDRREVKEDLSLLELIVILNLRSEQIAIELNQTVVRRSQWQATVLQEADKVEIVHFVGGG